MVKSTLVFFSQVIGFRAGHSSPTTTTTRTILARIIEFRRCIYNLLHLQGARSAKGPSYIISIHVLPASVVVKKVFGGLENLDAGLLGPTQRRSVKVEDNVGSLEGNVAKDVEANISRGLDTTVALVAEDGLL